MKFFKMLPQFSYEKGQERDNFLFVTYKYHVQATNQKKSLLTFLDYIDIYCYLCKRKR
jgi:hypothetical protein